MNASLEQIASKLAAADRILLTSHRGPDGDGVGSMVALAAILRGLGKRATLHSSDPVPRNLKWLPHVKTWTRKLRAESKYQVTVVVDCGDPKLLGPKFPKPEVSGELLVLDHHANARPFGDLFFSDPQAAATGVLVARLAEVAGWELNHEAALGIWVALVSDTGSFRYSNTNTEALALAARLVGAHQVSPWTVSENLDERVPLKRYRLLAKVLD
ncbi:MAG: DHH family phosphoesterase, partial [Deltaproteobacteria bacterium]|nr:DHH family phosphoesterase [Deltaproteobacteria bacterium]